MFLDRMLNQGPMPLVERMLQFTAARAEVIGENFVNIDTPDYAQRDLSLPAFQQMLQERRELRDNSPPGRVGFDDLKAELLDPKNGMLFSRPPEPVDRTAHDRSGVERDASQHVHGNAPPTVRLAQERAEGNGRLGKWLVASGQWPGNTRSTHVLAAGH